MMFRTVILVSSLMSCTVMAQDPVDTDGDKYKVVFENAVVRVLTYHDEPGERTHEHHHPAFVLYALAPFKRKISLPDGTVLLREFDKGDVLYSEAQTHIGENAGTSPTDALMIEIKPAANSELQSE
jgi:hypothetical protein